MTDDEHWMRSRRVLQAPEEWFKWDHPGPMVRALKGPVSDRKAHLLDAACFRRLWHWSLLIESHWAVEVLERRAEGTATEEEMRNACLALRQVREWTTQVMGGMWNQPFSDWEDRETEAWPTATRTMEAMSIAAGRMVRSKAGLEDDRPDWDQRFPEEKAQCDLLRCIFANPLLPSPSVAPGSVPDTVVRLAEASYEVRELPSGHLDPNRLAVLADAAEDAAVPREVVEHLRSPGPHWRGRWAVDLLLQKTE